jgi:hypothetical protein
LPGSRLLRAFACGRERIGGAAASVSRPRSRHHSP